MYDAVVSLEEISATVCGVFGGSDYVWTLISGIRFVAMLEYIPKHGGARRVPPVIEKSFDQGSDALG